MHRLAFTLPDVGFNEVGGHVYLEDGFLVMRVIEKTFGIGESDPHLFKIEPSAIAALTVERKSFRRYRLVIRPKKPDILNSVPGDHDTALYLRIKRKDRAELAAFVTAYDALPLTAPPLLDAQVTPSVRHITSPTRIPVPGGKLIEEYIGRVHTSTESLSVAHMVAPPGWDEPYQAPTFAEVTIVLRGTMRVEHADGVTDVGAGETVLVEPGVRVRYSNPFETEAEYWAVCTPAFAPDAAQREAKQGGMACAQIVQMDDLRPTDP